MEVTLSRRDGHETYLIRVRHNDEEIWRNFKIDDTNIAIEVFKVLDDFLHKLKKEMFELIKYQVDSGGVTLSKLAKKGKGRK